MSKDNPGVQMANAIRKIHPDPAMQAVIFQTVSLNVVAPSDGTLTQRKDRAVISSNLGLMVEAFELKDINQLQTLCERALEVYALQANAELDEMPNSRRF